MCLAMMCISVIYKCLSWDGNQQRDLGKPSWKNSQAKLRHIVGKLLGILSNVVSERTRSALRREQAWNLLLRCFQHWVTQVCIKQRCSMIHVDVWRYNSWVCMHVTDSIFCLQVKYKPFVHWACAFILELSTVVNSPVHAHSVLLQYLIVLHPYRCLLP
jgi:hypothetical protein